MGKRVQLTTKEKIAIFAIFLLHAGFLYLLSNYSKAMETYPDEIIYYDIAKSIFEGKSFMLHGVELKFTKIAYSLVLLPTFLIKNVVLRVRAIMLINSILMSLSFIPCYLICKELEVRDKYCRLAALLICFWPDIVISGTFMSENLYFPITAFAFYYILLSYKYEKRRYTVIVLVLSFLAYFTKEIGICVLLAYVATEVVSKASTFVRIFVNLAAAVFVYLIVHIVFFGGISNFYIKSGALDISYFMDYQVLLYLIYGFFYTLISTVLAFWVLPVLLPLVNYKKLSRVCRKYLLFTVLLMLGSILVISVTITAREDFGKAIPGVHLRYLAGIIVPFISIFFAYLSQDDKLVKGKGLWINIGLLVLASFVFKGIYNTCTTGTIGLQYVYVIRKIFGAVYRVSDSMPVVYPAGIATILGFAVFILIFHLAARRRNSLAAYTFFCGAMLLSAMNIAIGCFNVYHTYVDDKAMITEMMEIDEYFRNKGLLDKNVAFIDESQFSEEAKVYDLYFRSANRQYMILTEDIRSGNEILVEPIIKYSYKPDKIDYFIVNNISENFEDILDGVTLISELSSDTYSVFKNENPATIMRKEEND